MFVGWVVFVNFLKQNRKKLFPGIKDFSIEHPEFSQRKLTDLTLLDAFWFHPGVYAAFKWYFPTLSFVLFSYLGIILFNDISFNILTFLCLIMCILNMRQLLKNFKDRKAIMNTNFYNVFIKDKIGGK